MGIRYELTKLEDEKEWYMNRWIRRGARGNIRRMCMGRMWESKVQRLLREARNTGKVKRLKKEGKVAYLNYKSFFARERNDLQVSINITGFINMTNSSHTPYDRFCYTIDFDFEQKSFSVLHLHICSKADT